MLNVLNLTLKPMTDTFRSLCAELLQGLDENRHPEVRYPGHLRIVMARARAALKAQPEPQGVSDEEIRLFVEKTRTDWIKAVIQKGLDPDDFDVVLARAVLARWQHAQPEPQGPSETAWALAQLLDGVQRHDLPNMTGLSDSDCDRIWAARPAIEPVPKREDVHYAWELHDAELEGGNE